ncbi:MAG: sigma factor-like helix-turn-helix DNA-binding protein [Candidatus Shapirobacteria bacterium]
MTINYFQLYQKLTKNLNPKTKDIFGRRFGVKSGTPETLEAIGKTLGITRERVRQIEEAGFNVVRKNNKEALETIFADFENYFKNHGGFKKEESILEELGGKKARPYILFLLTLGDQFSRVCEKKDYHYFWSNLPNAQSKVKETLNTLVSEMKKIGKPINQKDFYAQVAQKQGVSEEAILSYLEVSKRIQPNREGALGLIEWPEIKPRGVKDKAYLVFKKHGKPLHFTEVAKLIDGLEYNMPTLALNKQDKKTYPQTVHNELIKDTRFVLVGRGTYALSEWGYMPGTIKDIITQILEEKRQPTHKDEVVKQVLAQRLVAKNTVLMNLNNKKYFDKDSGDKYFIKGIQIA